MATQSTQYETPATRPISELPAEEASRLVKRLFVSPIGVVEIYRGPDAAVGTNRAYADLRGSAH